MKFCTAFYITNTGKLVTKAGDDPRRCKIVALVDELCFCARRSAASRLATAALG